MFFNVSGIKWTLLAIAVVVLLCALDVHCSNRRDEKAAVNSSLLHVKDEMKAGQQAFAQQRADQINAQLRDLRILAKHLVKKGETKRARAAISLIQELEQQQKRLENAAAPKK